MAFLGEECIRKLVQLPFNTVLDIGCGAGKHTAFLKSQGKSVTSTDLFEFFPGVVAVDYMQHQFKPHDAIWCSHVLEHQLDVHAFLTKVKSECKEGGYIAITVPPLKHEIVGGHINLFNAGLLLYRMILAGIDCSDAMVGCYGYNVSVIARNYTIKDMPELVYNAGDIERLAKYFPMPVKQAFNGKDVNVNW